VLLEPYARAYYFGSERVSKRYGTEPEQDGCAYKDIKAMCEQPYSGYYLFSLLFKTAVVCIAILLTHRQRNYASSHHSM